jgi:hypothetical protein
MTKQLIKTIIIAILGVLTGYQAGNPNSMARAYLLPEPHEEVPTAYGIAQKGKTMAVADLLWAKTSTDTIQVGNFPPVVLRDTAYLSTALETIYTDMDPRKVRTWQKNVIPPAFGYEVAEILKLRRGDTK